MKLWSPPPPAARLVSSIRGHWPELVAIAATWGTAFLFIKLAVGGEGGLPPFAPAAMRGGLTAAALGLWFAATRRRFTPTSRELRHMAVLGLLNGLAPNALTAVALTRIDSAPAAMIQASTPLFVAGLAHFILSGERLGTRGFVGALVGLAGVFLLIGPEAVLDGRAAGWGALTMLVAAFSYALATVYVRHAKPTDPPATALGQQLFATVPAVLLALAFEPHSVWIQPVETWAALAGLAVASTAVPMVLYFRLLAVAPAGTAALVQYLLPLAATLYGVLLLGERLSPTVVVGGVVVLAGVWIAGRAR